MNSEAAPTSRLFTLRIWMAAEGVDTLDWRARVQDIQSGEVVYFKDWQALAAYIERVLQDQNKDKLYNRRES